MAIDRKLKKRIQKLEKEPYVEDVFVFLDNKNEVQVVCEYVFADHSVRLESLLNGQTPSGYINVHQAYKNRLFLGEVYTYDCFRGRGIATKMNKILDYVLNDYEGYILRGSYEPTQLSTDRQNGVYCSEEELDRRARAFYKSAGFTVLTLDEFKAHPELYPNFSQLYDFQLGEELCKTIVIKEIKKKDINFDKVDGVFVDPSAEELFEEHGRA